MGMYTGLRVCVTIEEKYREMIADISNGGHWSSYVKRYPFLKEFAELERADFIPHGALSYMPDEWDEIHKFDLSFNKDNGGWTFKCSLKNYNQEIELFIARVLSEITQISYYVETKYEESDYGELWSLVHGRYADSGYTIMYY